VTKPSKSPLVVLADDHDDTRDMYAQFLSKNGFRVAAAADGMRLLLSRSGFALRHH
jgi:CheY-like chemotaxis protein